MMSKSLGIPMGLRCKQSWGTTLTNLRDHKAYKRNLGNGYECFFLAYTVSIVLIIFLALSHYQRVEVPEKQGKD